MLSARKKKAIKGNPIPWKWNKGWETQKSTPARADEWPAAPTLQKSLNTSTWKGFPKNTKLYFQSCLIKLENQNPSNIERAVLSGTEQTHGNVYIKILQWKICCKSLWSQTFTGKHLESKVLGIKALRHLVHVKHFFRNINPSTYFLTNHRLYILN